MENLAINLTQKTEAVAAGAEKSQIRLVSSHKLSAGFPSPASDYMEDGLDLNEYLVRNKPASFMFTVKGFSMVNAGIVDGDKVIVDRSVNPHHRDIVVAVVDGEYTIKRLHMTEGRVELHPENPDFKAMVFKDGEQLEIWGVVVGVVRKYGSAT